MEKKGVRGKEPLFSGLERAKDAAEAALSRASISNNLSVCSLAAAYWKASPSSRQHGTENHIKNQGNVAALHFTTTNTFHTTRHAHRVGLQERDRSGESTHVMLCTMSYEGPALLQPLLHPDQPGAEAMRNVGISMTVTAHSTNSRLSRSSAIACASGDQWRACHNFAERNAANTTSISAK